MQNWIDFASALTAVISVIAAVLAWVAKIRWSKEFAAAKDETIKAKEAEINLLKAEIQSLTELNPMRLREYFKSVTQQLEEYNDDLQNKLSGAQEEIRTLKQLRSEQNKKDDLSKEFKELVAPALDRIVSIMANQDKINNNLLHQLISQEETIRSIKDTSDKTD